LAPVSKTILTDAEQFERLLPLALHAINNRWHFCFKCQEGDVIAFSPFFAEYMEIVSPLPDQEVFDVWDARTDKMILNSITLPAVIAALEAVHREVKSRSKRYEQ
jgi:hypothetical protein